MEKRGQVTIFVIVGILILFSTALIIYVTTIQKEHILTDTPDRSTIEGYVSSCLLDIGVDSIKAIASQGGYLEMPIEITSNMQAFTSLTGDIRAHESPFKVPNWHYGGGLRIPSINFIQSSISEKVLQTFESCINDFKPFENTYIIEKKEGFDVETVIGEESVVIKINYPLKITSLAENKITEMDEFSVTINTRLKQMYDLAKEIVEKANEEAFLERITLDYMTISEGIPFTDMFFSCVPKSWRIDDIREQLKLIASEMTRSIRIKNTYFYQQPPGVTEYEKNRLIMQAGDRKYRDIKAMFFYSPEWEMRVSSSKARNGVLKAVMQKMLKYIPICVQVTQFTYNVDYNVMLILREDISFNGEGLVFNIGFPVVIRQNEPMRAMSGVSLPEFNEPLLYDDFCEANEASPEKSIIAYDLVTGREIYNVSVDYYCIASLCPLGYTDTIGRHYQIITKFPEGCSVPILIANKEGYIESQFFVVEDERVIEMPMIPLKELEVEVRKYLIRDLGTSQEKSYSLEDGDEFYIFFESPDDFQIFRMSYDDLNNESFKPVIPLKNYGSSYEINAFLSRNELLVGGYIGNFTYSFSDINTKTKIIINIAEQKPVPVSDIEQSNLASFLFFDQEYRTKLMPEFR